MSASHIHAGWLRELSASIASMGTQIDKSIAEFDALAPNVPANKEAA